MMRIIAWMGLQWQWKSGQALSFYHRKDGKVVSLEKSLVALSDGRKNFSEPVKVPTFLMSGGKQWGQKQTDGRYAIAITLLNKREYRFPLVVVTGEDGVLFDNMLLIQR